MPYPVDMPLVHRQIFNVCGIVPQYCVYRFWLSSNGFFDYFKRYQPFVPHVPISPILFVVVSARHFSYGLSYFCNVCIICQWLHHDSQQSNRATGLPALIAAILTMLSPTVHCQLLLPFPIQEIRSACPAFQSSCP